MTNLEALQEIERQIAVARRAIQEARDLAAQVAQARCCDMSPVRVHLALAQNELISAQDLVPALIEVQA